MLFIITTPTNIKMNSQGTSSQITSAQQQQLKPHQQNMYPSVQCKNPKCYFWTYHPTPGAKCVKCMKVLPIWAGYLNADKDNGAYIPPPPLERTDYQETWFYRETPRFVERTNTGCVDELIDCDPPQLKPTDDNDNDHEHLTNAQRVVREIMLIYKLDREGAMKKLEQMAKTAVVEYF